MLSSELLDNIKCAMSHACVKEDNGTSKSCAHCEIGYTFITREPIVLECGHHICKDCKEKSEKDAVKCNICGEQIKCTKTNGKASESLIKMLFKDLSSDLKEKFLKAVDKLNGKFQILIFFFFLIIFNENLDTRGACETRASTLRHKIKNEVDLRVEILKSQIDGAADELHKEIDAFFDVYPK